MGEFFIFNQAEKIEKLTRDLYLGDASLSGLEMRLHDHIFPEEADTQESGDHNGIFQVGLLNRFYVWLKVPISSGFSWKLQK